MNPIQALFNRARQEAGSIREDTIPNPLSAAGIGPAQVNYNPLRNVPVAGGLINTTVNGPLHALGLINEGTQNVAQGITGEGMLALAHLIQAARAASGPDIQQTPASQLADQVLAQGPAHPGRIMDLVQHFDNPLISMPAGALQMLANPANFAGPIGEAGQGLEAAARAPAAAAALRNVGAVLDASNRIQGLPLAWTKGARSTLLPEMFPKAAQAAAPATAAALQEALHAPTSAPPLTDVERLAHDRAAWLDFGLAPGNGDYARYARGAGLPVPRALPNEASPLAPQGFNILRAAKEQRAASMVQPASDLVGAARKTGAALPIEQLIGAAKNVAARDVPLPSGPELGAPAVAAPLLPAHPDILRNALAALEANAAPAEASATGLARLGAATARRPLSIVPDAGRLDLAGTPYAGAALGAPPLGAVTPAEEAAAKLATSGPLDHPVGLLQTAAPDLAGYAGQTRQQALGQLSSDEIDRLVNLAYPVEQAQANAIAKRQNPLDLADRAIERIQTSRPLVARLQQTAPDLAAKIALLPEADQAAATPRPMLGGDLAAGGGGFGIAPARIVGTLAGATAGGALGAGIGAATDGDNRLRGAAKGAALGALVGGNVGAVAPSFSDSADAALRIAFNDLKLANTDAAGNVKLVAGNGAGDILKQMNPFSGAVQRAEKKTFPGAVPRNALGTAANLLMNDHASGVPLMVRNVKAGLAQLPQVATDLEAAGRDPMAVAAAYERMRSPTMVALAGGDALREREILAAGGEAYHLQDLGQMNTPALTGMVKFGAAGLTSPRGLLLAPVTIGTGLVRGAAAPAIGSMHRLGVGVVENGGRDAVVELATAAKLQAAVPQILAAARARGIDPATLGPRIGEGILAGRTADPVFNQLYDSIFQDAAKAGGVEARATLGNYDQKTGMSAGVMKVAGVLFPGIDWNVEQAKILARGAAKHPLIARHVAEIASTPNPDDPRHRGQVGIGGPVGALMSGQAGGTFYVNPAYPFSPVGGDLLNLPRDLDPALHPGMLPYDRASKIAGAVGAGINPALQIAAYETGNTDTTPTSADRLLPAEQAADTALMRAVPGYNRLAAANPIAVALENAHAAETGGQALDRGDIQARIEQGRYVDPAVQRAAAAMVLEQTGLPISARANQPYLVALGDPNSTLYRQAEARTLGGAALGSLVNFVAPASGTAQTGTEARRTAIEATLQDPRDPRTQAILAQYGLPAGTAIPINQAQLQAYAATHGEAAAAQMQLIIDQIGRAYPVLRVDTALSDKERQALLQQEWEFQHQGLARLAPGYAQLKEMQYLQQAGLLPPGALAGQQRSQDLRTLPQNPLVPLGQQGTLAR